MGGRRFILRRRQAALSLGRYLRRRSRKSLRERTRSGRRVRSRRQFRRLPADARQRMGMDLEHLRSLSGFRAGSVRGILRALVRDPQGPARRQLRDARAARLQYLEEFLYAGPRRRLRRVSHLRNRVKSIHSKDNPQVKALIKLAGSSRERRRTGSTLLEGEHLVRAYQESGGIAETILASETALARPEVRDFFENIQDPGNLGAILRTAAAAGIPHIFLSKDSVFAWSPKVIRAGMGAHFFLSIFEGVDVGEFARSFRGSVVAMEPRARASLYELDLRGPVAWVFGNEGAGLSEGARRLAAHRVRIPMPGPAESLNVAAAVAICLFEQIRQRSVSTPAVPA